MSYQPLAGGERKMINIKVTTEHANSSYGQPALVMPDGGLLGVESWVLLDYRIERVSRSEVELLRRSPLAWEGASPVAAQIAAARPSAGRPEAQQRKSTLSVTLDAGEIERIKEIGNGNASAGVSRLVKEWREKQGGNQHQNRQAESTGDVPAAQTGNTGD